MNAYAIARRKHTHTAKSKPTDSKAKQMKMLPDRSATAAC